VLKPAKRRLDLGKFTTEKMFHPDLPYAMEKCSRGTRPPLRLPNGVAQELEHKSFFSRADVPTVAKLYETFFDAVAPAQHTLDLSHLAWGDSEVCMLAKALPHFVSLESLDLSRNRTGAEGCEALAEALKVNTALTDLNLYCNGIGPMGAKAMAEMLQFNTTLTSLTLARNKLDAEAGKALADALKFNTALT